MVRAALRDSKCPAHVNLSHPPDLSDIGALSSPLAEEEAEAQRKGDWSHVDKKKSKGL
jgi:hypothetical protein